MGRQWVVVGGEKQGGILVREGKDLKSPVASERLRTGAIVNEVCSIGDRVQYALLLGSGPSTGWVSVKAEKKELLVRRKFEPYAILGVSVSANNKEVKSAFRKASLACHPDRNPSASANEQFAELVRARDFLLNPMARLLYDTRHGVRPTQETNKWWFDWDQLFLELEHANPQGVDLEDESPEGNKGAIPRELSVPDFRLPPTEREIDIVVLGATGLVGMLTCRYLARKGNFTWALAGRDRRKLELVRDKFGTVPTCQGTFCVESAQDTERIADIAGSARVLIDCTGPRVLLGSAVAQACTRARTHYLDCSGWRSDVVYWATENEHLDMQAQDRGVCLICSCGWASAPADLGVWALVQHLRKTYSACTKRVESYETEPNLRASGTAQQAFAGVGGLAEAEKRLGEFMLGGVRPCGIRKEDCILECPEFKSDAHGVWVTPTVMPDRVVVRCSCGLLDSVPGECYGDNFSFRNWEIHSNKLNADLTLMHANAQARRPYSKIVEEGLGPPIGFGPGERLRESTVAWRIFEGETEHGQVAHVVSRLGPGGSGDAQEATAMVAVEAAFCLLEAVGKGVALRSGFGTTAYHLAHLGYFQKMIDCGWRFDIRGGPIPTNVLKGCLGQGALPLES